MAHDPRNISHSSLSSAHFLRVKNFSVWSIFLIGSKKKLKKESPFKHFFFSSIACCWPRESQKWVLCKRCPHRRCPLCKVELLGRMFRRKLPIAVHGRSWLSLFWDDGCDFRENIFIDTLYFYHILFSRISLFVLALSVPCGKVRETVRKPRKEWHLS